MSQIHPQNIGSLEAQSSGDTTRLHEDGTPTGEKTAAIASTTPAPPPPSFWPTSKKIAIFCAMLIVVFWILSAQIFGIFTNEAQNVKRGQVAVVNFDGNIIGSELIQSLSTLNRTDGYPTFSIVDPQSTTPERISDAVFQGHYWAAIYAQAGSTDRFLGAVNGSITEYDPMQAVSFITFEGRYFQVFAENMLQNLEIAINTASAQISGVLTSSILRNGNGSYAPTRPSISALAVPIVVSQRSAGPHAFTMDNKPLINTVGTVFLTLMAIFPCIASHHITMYARIFQHHTFRQHLLFRFTISLIWPLFASLSATGWTFAFRGSYPLTAKMFFAYWAVTWVYSIITFDVIDAILCFIPLNITSLVAVSWVIFSITATLGTPDLLNHWYRVNYFFPSFHWWETCITILTQGGNNHLDYNLPTLAGWLIVAQVAVVFGVRHQLRLARASK